jgi:hypothetical protein
MKNSGVLWPFRVGSASNAKAANYGATLQGVAVIKKN